MKVTSSWTLNKVWTLRRVLGFGARIVIINNNNMAQANSKRKNDQSQNSPSKKLKEQPDSIEPINDLARIEKGRPTAISLDDAEEIFTKIGSAVQCLDLLPEVGEGTKSREEIYRVWYEIVDERQLLGEKRKDIKIVLCGITGSGKTSLFNSLVLHRNTLHQDVFAGMEYRTVPFAVQSGGTHVTVINQGVRKGPEWNLVFYNSDDDEVEFPKWLEYAAGREVTPSMLFGKEGFIKTAQYPEYIAKMIVEGPLFDIAANFTIIDTPGWDPAIIDETTSKRTSENISKEVNRADCLVLCTNRSPGAATFKNLFGPDFYNLREDKPVPALVLAWKAAEAVSEEDKKVCKAQFDILRGDGTCCSTLGSPYARIILIDELFNKTLLFPHEGPVELFPNINLGVALLKKIESMVLLQNLTQISRAASAINKTGGMLRTKFFRKAKVTKFLAQLDRATDLEEDDIIEETKDFVKTMVKEWSRDKFSMFMRTSFKETDTRLQQKLVSYIRPKIEKKINERISSLCEEGLGDFVKSWWSTCDKIQSQENLDNDPFEKLMAEMRNLLINGGTKRSMKRSFFQMCDKLARDVHEAVVDSVVQKSRSNITRIKENMNDLQPFSNQLENSGQNGEGFTQIMASVNDFVTERKLEIKAQKNPSKILTATSLQASDGVAKCRPSIQDILSQTPQWHAAAKASDTITYSCSATTATDTELVKGHIICSGPRKVQATTHDGVKIKNSHTDIRMNPETVAIISDYKTELLDCVMKPPVKRREDGEIENNRDLYFFPCVTICESPLELHELRQWEDQLEPDFGCHAMIFIIVHKDIIERTLQLIETNQRYPTQQIFILVEMEHFDIVQWRMEAIKSFMEHYQFPFFWYIARAAFFTTKELEISIPAQRTSTFAKMMANLQEVAYGYIYHCFTLTSRLICGKKDEASEEEIPSDFHWLRFLGQSKMTDYQMEEISNLRGEIIRTDKDLIKPKMIESITNFVDLFKLCIKGTDNPQSELTKKMQKVYDQITSALSRLSLICLDIQNNMLANHHEVYPKFYKMSSPTFTPHIFLNNTFANRNNSFKYKHSDEPKYHHSMNDILKLYHKYATQFLHMLTITLVYYSYAPWGSQDIVSHYQNVDGSFSIHVVMDSAGLPFKKKEMRDLRNKTQDMSQWKIFVTEVMCKHFSKEMSDASKKRAKNWLKNAGGLDEKLRQQVGKVVKSKK